MNKWKADEMEMYVNFRAMRLAWSFTILALAAYIIYYIIKTSVIPTVPVLILSLQTIIFFVFRLISLRKMGGQAKNAK